MKHMHKTNHLGIVLLMVLGILGLMSVMAVTFVKITSLEKSISRNYIDRTKALLAAESGIDYAISRIQSLSGGALRGNDVAEMYYLEGTTPGLEHAKRASFQRPGVGHASSGILSSSYTPGGDYFILKVQDESSKLNLNDTDGQWNIDDDPVYDDPMTDPDMTTARFRLASLIEELGGLLFDPVKGTDISIALMTERSLLPGGRYSSLDDVRTVLEDNTVLSKEEIVTFLQYVTLDTWQDKEVLRPTFQLNITTPNFAPIPNVGYQEGIANLYFNVYLYSDFQTQYFEKESRSPVSVNSASKVLIEAILSPVQGWYLYEGAPASLMDASYTGPWIRAFRTSAYNWMDYERGKDLSATLNFSWYDVEAGHPSKDTQQFNMTRHGEARLTHSFRTEVPGLDLDADGQDDTIAGAIAQSLFDRSHGIDGNDDGDFDDGGDVVPQPFQTWDHFTRYIYQLVDLDAEIVAGEFSSASQEGERFPYRIGDGTLGSIYPGRGGDLAIPGFDRYMADALLANANPNALLNDHNPDFTLYRHVDKSQLTQYTTEFSLEPTGQFLVESLGVISDGSNSIMAKVGLESRMTLYTKLRFTTQEQFMEDYVQNNHDTLYNIFEEAGTLNYPASGADMEHGTGKMLAGGRWGPSLTSYPEPIRNHTSYTINNHPDQDQKKVYFSAYDGYLKLSTQQRSAELLPDTPTFMAPMSWRNISGMAPGQWARASMGVGGMLPALWGQNSEFNFDTGEAISTDDINNVGSADGQKGLGAIRIWTQLNDQLSINMSQYLHDTVLLAPSLPNPPYFSRVAQTPPLLNPDAGYPYMFNTPIVNSPGTFPYWEMKVYPAAFDSPWFDPNTGSKYQNWEVLMHHYADHQFMIPFVENVMIDGHREMPADPVWGWDHVERNVQRMGWNMPTDGPLTPHHIDTATNQRVDRVQGNLFADGTLSDPGRLLSYRATNLGSNTGFTGSLVFWVKPNFDTGYSNRMRVLFGMGHTSESFNDAYNIIYFPASPHMSKGDFPIGGSNENSISTPEAGTISWPVPRNSIMAGTMNTHWSKWGGGGPGPIETWHKMYTVTKTTTDFMPYRDFAERGSHESYGFYGHQWNLMGLSYNMAIDGNDVFLNGVFIERNDPEYNPAFERITNTPIGEFDPYWEEAHFHCHEKLNGAGGARGEPENLHQGEGYMRFGWLDEAGGPVSDATYDDIIGWGTELAQSSFEDMWFEGRYINKPLDDMAGTNFTAAGVYTSPSFDVYQLLKKEIGNARIMSGIRVHGVSWTLYWPRYNWRPQGGNSSPDWTQWAGGTYSGMDGVDLHGAGSTAESDPVYGDVDPITVDFWSDRDGRWIYSDDDGSGSTMYDNMDLMPSTAAGSRVKPTDPLILQPGDQLKYRLYFHTDSGQPLLESPTVDDITIIFSTGRIKIHSWKVLN